MAGHLLAGRVDMEVSGEVLAHEAPDPLPAAQPFPIRERWSRPQFSVVGEAAEHRGRVAALPGSFEGQRGQKLLGP